VDIDAKKAEVFPKGLTIQLQDRLILSQNRSYIELASAGIDQEGQREEEEEGSVRTLRRQF
jgi:hypothetical protein